MRANSRFYRQVGNVLVLTAGLTLAVSQSSTAQNAVRVETVATFEGGTGGITVAPDGTIYSSDFGVLLDDATTAGSKIFRISPDGKTEVFFEGIEGASGSAMDADGFFYQSNLRGGFISKISPQGKATRFASEGFQLPVGIEPDGEGNLYVANCGSKSIQRVSADGTSERFVESDLLVCPNGIVRDEGGTLYVANFFDGNVVKISPKAEVEVLTNIPGNNNGHLIYAHDALWVVARGSHQIYRVSLDGEKRVVAGSGKKGNKDGKAKKAQFCYPNDIGISPDGLSLYVNEVADLSSTGRLLAPTTLRRIVLEP